MKYIITIISFIWLGLINMQAQDFEKFGMDKSFHLPKGLKVGDDAPNLIAKDQNGNNINLYEILKSKVLVIQFYRGNWCPVCNKFYSEEAKKLQKLETDKNVKIVLVTPEPTTESKKFLSKHGIGISVVSDIDSKTMNAFDVRFMTTDTYHNKVLIGLQTSIKNHN